LTDTAATHTNESQVETDFEVASPLGGDWSNRATPSRILLQHRAVGYLDCNFSRLGAKPGITELWQVKGRRSVVHFKEVIRPDRPYMEGCSLWLDLRILLRAVLPAVMLREGTY